MNFTAIEIVKMEARSMEILGVSRTLGAQIILSVSILFILGLGLLVQKQLYSFLKTRNKRHINRIIIFNSVVQNITIPIVLCYFLIAIWIKNPSQFISDYGCHGMNFVVGFSLIFDRSTSFSINLYRYICILHDTQLKMYNIHPKMVAWFMMTANLGLAILSVVIFMISKGGLILLEYCRGRYELFYSLDYFYEGGFPIGYFTEPCFHSTYYCQFFYIINLLMSTNIIDMILIFKILMKMKSDTQFVSDLLTSNALNERKRNDGIIIAISIWQVIVESISTIIFMITNRQQPMNQQHKIILLVLFQLSITFIVLPSFYLLADNRFRLALKDKGFFRSIWSALKQKYENQANRTLSPDAGLLGVRDPTANAAILSEHVGINAASRPDNPVSTDNISVLEFLASRGTNLQSKQRCPLTSIGDVTTPHTLEPMVTGGVIVHVKPYVDTTQPSKESSQDIS